MKKIYFFKTLAQSLLVIAVTIFSGCDVDAPLASEEIVEEPTDNTGDEDIDEPENPIEEPEEIFSPYFEQQDSKINEAVNDFDMELFQAMINNDELTSKFPNAAISPLSISFALSMAANTFDNQFASEVLSKLQSDDLAQLNMYFRRLMANMPEGCVLKLANSSWYFDRLIKPSKTYCSNLAKSYSAPVEPIDFSNSEKAASVINGWVADNTDNLIDKIITPKDLENAVVVLANALSFDGKWMYEFDEKLTKKDVFHGANGDAEVDYLNIKKTLCYYESPEVKAVTIPFNGASYDLMVFIPNDGETISSIIGSLNADDVTNIYYQMPECIVDLSIPKFSSDLNDQCTDIIESTGIHMRKPHSLVGFTGDEHTEFDNQVSEVYHAAKMSINEKGALAASATVIIDMSGGKPISPTNPKEVTLKIDCPFFYLLRNRIHNNILIAGCYTQP